MMGLMVNGGRGVLVWYAYMLYCTTYFYYYFFLVDDLLKLIFRSISG